MKNLLRNVAYASVIIASLTITLHQFNRPADAQGSAQVIGYQASVGFCTSGTFMLSNGDLYEFTMSREDCSWTPQTTFVGNVWGGGPINSESSTWGRSSQL